MAALRLLARASTACSPSSCEPAHNLVRHTCCRLVQITLWPCSVRAPLSRQRAPWRVSAGLGRKAAYAIMTCPDSDMKAHSIAKGSPLRKSTPKKAQCFKGHYHSSLAELWAGAAAPQHGYSAATARSAAWRCCAERPPPVHGVRLLCNSANTRSRLRATEEANRQHGSAHSVRCTARN
jgi:hypothetical protein